MALTSIKINERGVLRTRVQKNATNVLRPAKFLVSVDLGQRTDRLGAQIKIMPLDPNRFFQKKPSRCATAWQAIVLAMEWSAIIFIGMLAVLFLCWALAVQSPSERWSPPAGNADNISRSDF